MCLNVYVYDKKGGLNDSTLRRSLGHPIFFLNTCSYENMTTGSKIACLHPVLQDVAANRLLFPEVINRSLGLIIYQGSPQRN